MLHVEPLYSLVFNYSISDFHPIGHYFILWFWGRIFGFSEVAIRMPSVLFGVITIYILYLLGKEIFSRKVGLIAALLLAVNPLHIYYSQEARVYSFACLAVALNIYLFYKLIKKLR
jgi:uncharacterized membrane protein